MKTTKRLEAYKAMAKRLAEIQAMESAHLEQMDKLWRSLNAAEIRECTACTCFYGVPCVRHPEKKGP